MAVVTKTNTEKGHTRNLIGIMIDDDDDDTEKMYRYVGCILATWHLASCKSKAECRSIENQ
jgi:hypothetical protein